jgi:hypothetical protein
MGLRDLKRSGGFLLPDARGAWLRYEPGELMRCPVPHCKAGLSQPDAYSVGLVRVAMEGLGEPGQPSGFTLCPDNRCKTRLQIRYEPAEGMPNREMGRLKLQP